MTINVLGFTGSRADFFLQRPFFKSLEQNPEINFALIISGGILDEDSANTLEAINLDGFNICAFIKIDLSSDDTHLRAIGNLINALPPHIKSFNPDLCVVYADRYESFAFALSCFHLNKVILHVEAGDLTYGGTFDDSIRHAITHISHLYSVATLQSYKVLQNFGISPERIHLTGLLSYDNLKDLQLLDPFVILSDLFSSPNLPLILATYHPIPRNPQLTKEESSNFFASLRSLSNIANIIITSPNHDGGRNLILEQINELTNETKVLYIESLGAQRYYSLMAYSDRIPVVVAGNSSSILKEAPYFNAHSLNVGVRQLGRVSSSSQVNVPAKQHHIEAQLKLLCTTPCGEVSNPYFQNSPANQLSLFIVKAFREYSHSSLIANNLMPL